MGWPQLHRAKLLHRGLHLNYDKIKVLISSPSLFPILIRSLSSTTSLLASILTWSTLWPLQGCVLGSAVWETLQQPNAAGAKHISQCWDFQWCFPRRVHLCTKASIPCPGSPLLPLFACLLLRHPVLLSLDMALINSGLIRGPAAPAYSPSLLWVHTHRRTHMTQVDPVIVWCSGVTVQGREWYA